MIVDPNTGAVVQDSWEIALYLDKQYPDTPRSLFHGESNIGVHQLVYESMQMPIISGVFRKCVLDIMRNLSGDLAKWFRQSRENMMGCSLEEFASDADVQLEKSACATLQSVHKVLERNAYVTGSQGNQQSHQQQLLRQSLCTDDDHYFSSWLRRCADSRLDLLFIRVPS